MRARLFEHADAMLMTLLDADVVDGPDVEVVVLQEACLTQVMWGAMLELTGDNRASAAEMLGLSRQSFYAKLRRHGLGDLGADDEA